MSDIIREIKETFPFSMTEDELCAETCRYGCAKKLMEYLYMEITEWEQRLASGEIPNFGDIQNITQTAKKIHKVLEKNNLVSVGD
ncbi:hypothetical protein ACFL2V_09710 [Pseudomonadota bacterium]